MKCSLFPFVGYSLGGGGGGGDLGSGSGSKFNRAARVGSGWVRQSRVRAGFGLQFWARADLYSQTCPRPRGPLALHILYVSLIIRHPIQFLQSLLTRWWVESGVLDKGDIQKVQGRTAVKPAAVQKNTVKPAAIEIDVRVYYNDYGNHRNNTEETRF